MMKNVHGNTVDHLGEAIVGGRYRAGEAIPTEPILGAELGVSRTVVREAVKSLVAKGLVTSGPKVGTRVLAGDHWNWFDPDVIHWQAKAGLTPEFLRDLMDLRRVVEPAAVRLAVRHATEKDIADISAALEGMKRAVKDGGDYVTHDLQFHQGLLQACRNRMLIHMSKALSALLRTSFEVSTSKKGKAASSISLHQAVLDAVIARDSVKAEKAIMVLIDGAHQDIEEILASRRRLPRLNLPASRLKATAN
ncbi:MAG: FadR/GntR family transcriptional regulator [Rhodoferax sp.]|nr:FadR/GntR family transcriptional regulator [Rhodoferax sp.]